MNELRNLGELQAAFAGRAQFKEIWAIADIEQSMCALINGNSGWLMYLRFRGDAGFNSRNPDYDGLEDAVQEYYLNNGQRDEYPLAWAIPIEDIRRAMEFFIEHAKPAPWINWYNNSGDGETIGND